MRTQPLIILLIVLASAGCSVLMPPQKIPLDRRNYLDAVSTSWKEQLLDNLVRLRYGDTLTFLEMTSINTSYSLDANLTAGYSTRWNPFAGVNTVFRNLFSAGGSVTYADRPTISYAPIRGEALAKTLTTPIGLSKVLKSLQAGWRDSYIFSCCVKSINDLRNRQDSRFFDLAQLFDELKSNGVIRLTVEDPVEPKVTKVPTEYTVTLKDKRNGAEKSESGKEPTVKAATKPKKGKENGGGTDKRKEEKEDTEIGLIVLDKDRAKRLDEDLDKDHAKHLRLDEEKFKYKIERFKKLLWSNSPPREKELYNLYNNKCLSCHGAKEASIGPDNILSYLKPGNVNDPKFWVDEVDQKITQAVTRGHGRMAKLDMKPEELKAVITYIKHALGRYEVYKIIDGNRAPPQSDPNCDKIVMQTRSILQIFHLLSDFIEVPEAHITEKKVKKSDLVERKEPLNGNVQPVNSRIMFEIKSNKELPKDAFVAVQQRDYWFYIDDNDLDSKRVFSSTAGILSMSESGTKEGAPLLTLPVQ